MANLHPRCNRGIHFFECHYFSGILQHPITILNPREFLVFDWHQSQPVAIKLEINRCGLCNTKRFAEFNGNGHLSFAGYIVAMIASMR